jgi:nitrite reductase (NADH) large subunit
MTHERQTRPLPRKKLVVVGNGMAGIRTVEELLALAPDLYDIAIFGAEPHPNYNRVLLGAVLCGEQTIDEIVLNPLAWYAEHGIRLHLGRKVVRIDRARRLVRAEDGTEEPYDRLLIATGSKPNVPSIPGTDLEGVIAYRDLADTRAMIECTQRYRHAVVVGAGLLGLEAAHGLAERGMQVQVVHLGRWLMDRQLDRDAATLLRQSLESRGIRFLLDARTAELIGNTRGRVEALRLADGTRIPADVVVIAAGIRPDTALAEAAGLHCRRGIVVDDTMQAVTDPRVYAVGECAAHRGIAYGLVAPVYEQAKVCATHLAHEGSGRYPGSQASTRLKVAGIDLFSAGNVMGALSGRTDDAGCEEIVMSDPYAGVYKKLVLKDGTLVGACLYGDTVDGAYYFELLRQARRVDDVRHSLMFGPPPVDGAVQGDVLPVTC